MKKISIATALISLILGGVGAQEHAAHEHGIAEMHIVRENQNLEITLHIPGADFIGFEHSDLADEEKEALEKKIEEVEAAEDLISFKAGWFNRITHLETELHSDVHDEQHEDHEEHGEYELHLLYSIHKPEALKRASFTGLFELFPSLEEIDWVLIGPSGQNAGVITADSDQIDFR